MANTLLNVPGRQVLQASSNPQANVEQVNSQNNIQPTTSNANTAQGIQPNTTQQNTQQTVNPITIPIQIQPQITTTDQSTATQSTNNVQALSVEPTQEPTQQTQSAPTPQPYQEQTSSNSISFNQIYSQYQNAFGSNPSSTGSSGVKKTSLNTTIVTPTVNLNSVEGMYQSAYADTINSLISQMITQLNQGFQYDPNSDEALKIATEYAANSTLQSLAGSGVLNSTATSERVARIVSELIPQYEEKAHDRYLEYLNQLATTAQVVMDYDSQQFQVWKDAKDREFQEKEFAYQKQQDAIENAWKRVDELGYVDNEASTILGVAVGTLSGEARLAKEQREFELQKMREQAQIEYENNKALYELKNQLDIEQSKALTEYEYQMQQKYGSSSNSGTSSANTTSLSTYKDIINNRWAEYDDFTKKYTVTDNSGLYTYLVTEYSSGRMSASDLANLTAMYNVTQPTSSDTAKQERLKYLESLEQYR